MRKQNPFAVLIFFIIFCLGAGLAYAMFETSGNPQSVWVGIVAFVIAVVFSLAIKVANQWERAVVLRLGKFHCLRGPGLFFIVPIIDSIPYWIDIRVITTSSVLSKKKKR
jgi:regulator of protease activity HflC (stomatin/prohibitin superfamily)